MGTEHVAARILLRHSPFSSSPDWRIEHTCTFEIVPSARDVLRLSSKCALFGDLCSLLPEDVRTWYDSRTRSMEAVIDKIVGERVLLLDHAFCHRATNESTLKSTH